MGIYTWYDNFAVWISWCYIETFWRRCQANIKSFDLAYLIHLTPWYGIAFFVTALAFMRESTHRLLVWYFFVISLFYRICNDIVVSIRHQNFSQCYHDSVAFLYDFYGYAAKIKLLHTVIYIHIYAYTYTCIYMHTIVELHAQIYIHILMFIFCRTVYNLTDLYHRYNEVCRWSGLLYFTNIYMTIVVNPEEWERYLPQCCSSQYSGNHLWN